MTSTTLRRMFAAGLPLAIVLTASTVLSATALAQKTRPDSVLVTATRLPQTAEDVLSDYTVIGPDEIARSGGSSLADLLQRQRSIEITRNGGPGTQSSVFLRGTDSRQNVVLIDGVRVGSATSGSANWSAIPLSQIERVEIVYGPLSTMYGADAVGGVIQIFSKQGDGAPVPTASLGTGSDATRNAEAGISGSNGGWRYAMRAAHERSDGFSAKTPGTSGYNPDRDGHDSDSASGQLAFSPARNQEIGAGFFHSRLKSQFDSGPDYDDRTTATVATYSIYAKDRFLSNWDSEIRLSQSADHSTNDASFGRPVYDTTQTIASWQNSFRIGTADVFQLTAEHRKEDVDSTVTALTRDRTTNSLATAYQWHKGPHIGSASLRGDRNSQFGSHATGSLAYGYRISSSLRINASAGTSFRAPTFNDLYFPNFGIASNQPEKGRNAEVGLSHENGNTRYSAVVYRNELTDMLVYTPVCPIDPASRPFGCTYNVNEALLTGLSLEASTVLGAFSLRGSLDLQDPQDETTGDRLARRARRHGTVALDHHAGQLTLGGELVMSGERFDDADNQYRLAGYGVLNLYASQQLGPDWSLFGRWNNVLDRNYELARGYNTSDSSVFVGVRYDLR